MRITYREGECVILAEAQSLSLRGKVLTASLPEGKHVNFPFPSEEIAQQFFEEVIVPSGDRPIRLEQTNFDPRLSALISDWDSLYE